MGVSGPRAEPLLPCKALLLASLLSPLTLPVPAHSACPSLSVPLTLPVPPLFSSSLSTVLEAEDPGISEQGPWTLKTSRVPDPMRSPVSCHDAPHGRRSGPPGPDSTLAGAPSTPRHPWAHQMNSGFEGPALKRRGGVVDHRDVILAHQAHKIHSTPQARRKEWE